MDGPIYSNINVAMRDYHSDSVDPALSPIWISAWLCSARACMPCSLRPRIPNPVPFASPVASRALSLSLSSLLLFSPPLSQGYLLDSTSILRELSSILAATTGTWCPVSRPAPNGAQALGPLEFRLFAFSTVVFLVCSSLHHSCSDSVGSGATRRRKTRRRANK